MVSGVVSLSSLTEMGGLGCVVAKYATALIKQQMATCCRQWGKGAPF